MKRRKWTAEEKLKVVVEGLQGGVTIAELCNRYQITQTQYYQWRDHLLGEGHKIFNRGGIDKQSQHLEAENRKLKEIIGDLPIELKKTTSKAGI